MGAFCDSSSRIELTRTTFSSFNTAAAALTRNVGWTTEDGRKTIYTRTTVVYKCFDDSPIQIATLLLVAQGPSTTYNMQCVWSQENITMMYDRRTMRGWRVPISREAASTLPRLVDRRQVVRVVRQIRYKWHSAQGLYPPAKEFSFVARHINWYISATIKCACCASRDLWVLNVSSGLGSLHFARHISAIIGGYHLVGISSGHFTAHLVKLKASLLSPQGIDCFGTPQETAILQSTQVSPTQREAAERALS